ncbi:unnamed protein product [Rotaria sp. Silwood2]|nr:unnamed protein product [Rotaria sp. Silwood2]
MAAILSDAVYEENPIEYINKNYSSSKSVSTLVGLKFAKDACYPYLLGITKTENNKETMWIAFRGTTNWEDIITDITAIPTIAIAGMVHQGFWERASKFPHNRFAEECYIEKSCFRRLIFTGHSLGGSVAHLCALKHLDAKSSNESPQIFSITFGAPFFGNRTVAEDLLKRNLSKHFLTIVNQSDCVPNILNIIENANRLNTGTQHIKELCMNIISMFISVFKPEFKMVKSVAKYVCSLNEIIRKLKDALKNMNLEYKSIGTYGFIHVYAPESNSQPSQWKVIYMNNHLNTDFGTLKFIDSISNKLTSLYGSTSQMYTDTNIISHFMNKYIEALKSCETIEFDQTNNGETTMELNQFDPILESATAVCHNTDIKIALIGKNLDFISSHKPDCLRSLPQLFEKGSVMIPLEQTQHRVILINNMLIPTEKRIKVGPQKYILQTHFGEITCDISWNKNMSTYPFQSGMFSKFDLNFLTSAFLRSNFAYVHSNKNMTVKEVINGDPTILQYFVKLIQNRLPDQFGPFLEKLQKHFIDFTQRKINNEPLLVTDSLFNDSIAMLTDLHEALTKPPNYIFDKPIKQRAAEHPVFFTVCSIGLVVGVAVFFQAAAIGLFSYEIVSGATVLASRVGGPALIACVSGVESTVCGAALTKFGNGMLKRVLYHGHVNLLLDSMGGESNNCADEEMTEIEICKILNSKSINFRTINLQDKKQLENIIKEKDLFNTEGTRERPTLKQTVIESKLQAFKLLHDVYFIQELRKYMTEHIYVSFVGAHRAGKSSLLRSLWNLPALIGDSIASRTKELHIYTLKDVAKNDKLHIIDFPGVTDPEKRIGQLTRYYSICSSFYVIVAQAKTDYAEASKLIDLLRSPTMPAHLENSLESTCSSNNVQLGMFIFTLNNIKFEYNRCLYIS